MGGCLGAPNQEEYERLDPKEQARHYKRIIGIIVVVSLVLLVAATVAVGVLVHEFGCGSDDDDFDIVQLPPGVVAINITNLNEHLIALNLIGEQNNNTRAFGTPGYAASRDYVVNQLQQAGYKPVVQNFTHQFWSLKSTPAFTQVSPVQTNYTQFVNFRVVSFSPSTPTNGIQGPLFKVPNLGCDASDYATFPGEGGYIALIDRGNCSFVEKAGLAAAASAQAAIFINVDDTTPSVSGDGAAIPAIIVARSIGTCLTPSPGETTVVSLKINANFTSAVTWNVWADTPTGNPDSTVIIGSHLDSVPAGPGINDNGSGTSTNLAMALQIKAQNYPLINRIRFAWWAAEEIGLVGSTFYVSNLMATNMTAFNQLAVNINIDMLGSPNFQRGIYDGKSAKDASIRNASALVQNLFTKVFQVQNISTEYVPFDGRSDYGPFIANGVPAGGLFTGAEQLKTQNGRVKYGGLANAQYDPCYHQSCDTYLNINQEVIEQMGNAVITVVLQLAQMPNLMQAMNRTVAATPSTKRFIHPAEDDMMVASYREAYGFTDL